MKSVSETIYWIHVAVAENITILNEYLLQREYSYLEFVQNRWFEHAKRSVPVDFSHDVPKLYFLATMVQAHSLGLPTPSNVPEHASLWELYQTTKDRSQRLVQPYHVFYTPRVLISILQDPVVCRSIDMLLMSHAWVLLAYPVVKSSYDRYISPVAMAFTSQGITVEEYSSSGDKTLYACIDPLVSLALKYHEMVSQVTVNRIWSPSISRIICSFVTILETASIDQDYQYPTDVIQFY